MKYIVKKEQESFHDLLELNSKEEKEASFSFYKYIDGNLKIEKVTTAEVKEKAEDIGEVLKKNGAVKGDRVVIFDTQSQDNIESVAASICTGLIFTFVPVPIDAGKINRFLSVVKSCEPKFILCSDKLDGLITKLIASNNGNDTLNKVKIINVDKCAKAANFIPEKVDADDVIYIQYSSGSTSAPKGVMITYGNILSMVNSQLEITPYKRLFGWLPFFHNIGLLDHIFVPLIDVKFKVGILATMEFLKNPIRWFEGASHFRAEGLIAPNSVYDSFPKIVPASILKDKNIDFSNLKVLSNGSEVVSYDSMARFAKEYESFGINVGMFLSGYGLSESTCCVAIQRSYSRNDDLFLDFDAYKEGKMVITSEEDKNSIEFVPCGEPVPHTSIKIVNPNTLEECKKDEFGEIWINGACVAKGYYKNEEATKETFGGKLKNSDEKYIRTGDLGIIRNNMIYVTGRIKELIIINGNNIMPNDIQIKIKESIPELRDTSIIPFSTVKNNKEKLIVLISSIEMLIDKVANKEMINRINKCILDNFEVTPYETAFIYKKYVPTSDNGKVSILKTAKLYSEDKLELVRINKENSNSKIEFKTKTEKLLAEIIKREFEVSADRNENLLSLGMNSLKVVQLIMNVEKDFKVSIPAAFIFENPTIEKIAAYVEKAMNGEDLSSLEKDKSYLRDEVELAEEIKPEKYESSKPEMKEIFLTGSTGFLGAYLIDRFINENRGVKVYCHVRAKDDEAGFNRIVDNMKYYKLWKAEYRENIIPVLGALDKPLLGIEKDKYKYLAEHIDTIYHNGAILNFIYPYESLKEVNVNGTKRTLALACTGKPKYYNYISSYSVYDNPSHFKKEVLEDDNLDECRGYYLSYSESKWVAENIIKLARKRGLRASIYRPGEITGSTTTGIWKLGDSVSRTIKAMMKYGMCADINMNIHMVQVDYVASAIASISKKGEAYGHAYNLMNSVNVPMRKVGEVIEKNGYKIKYIDYETWRELLFKSGTDNPLKLLEELFKIRKKNPDEDMSARYSSKIGPRFSTRNSEKMLEGTGIKCKPISEELMGKYINNFR